MLGSPSSFAHRTGTSPASHRPSFFSLFPFPHAFPPLVDDRQFASWRTLPYLIHNHNTLFMSLLSFPTSCGCLAVCLLEDTVSASASSTHPRPLSRLSRMHGSVLTGGRCRLQFIAIHTLPSSHRWLTASSLEDAVSTLTLLTWSRTY